MKILKTKYLLLCDKEFKILQNHAIIFDNEIKEILPISKLKNRGIPSSAQVFSSAVALPALSNAHTHLEYSANKAHLDFNGFTAWLKSVFENRSALGIKLKANLLQKQIKNILASGVCALGEYSSFGLDLELAKSPLRTRFYCEILGTNENFLQASWQGFLARFNEAKKLQNECFKPAIAVHSPYSTHKELAKKAINLANEQDLLLSAHLAESIEEMEFLEGKNNDFKHTLSFVNPNIKPLYSLGEFISMFDKDKTLFIHCVHAKNFFDKLGFIAHCPRSNRFLSSGVLDIKKAAKHATIALGTDGLSSNLSLDLWDELRSALFIHKDNDLNDLAKRLLLSATSGGAKALGFNSGVIEVGKNADIACFALPQGTKENRLALDLILHTKKAKALFIGGEKIAI